MSKIKINSKNFFINKNKFVHLEKNMILISPNCEYNYFPPISDSYFGELLLHAKSIPVLKRIRSVNTYLVKLFREIIFFYNPSELKQLYVNIHVLDLNFAKKRFFPQLKNINSLNNNQETIFNNSLGITSKHFSKSKKFLKSKASYMFSASYIRRFLTYLRVEDLSLLVRKIPVYLKDIIRVILSPTNVLYKNPFLDQIVNEKKSHIKFTFAYVNFHNNKPYGIIKRKKKGRLKRKISKRVIMVNNILD